MSGRRLVSSSKELGAALTDATVTHVVIRRKRVLHVDVKRRYKLPKPRCEFARHLYDPQEQKHPSKAECSTGCPLLQGRSGYRRTNGCQEGLPLWAIKGS